MTVLVAGAGGFIGGHLVKRLLEEGEEVRAVDCKPLNDWWQLHPDATNYSLDMLRQSHVVTDGATEVYDLSEQMGGIGFIETHVADCGQSVRIGLNMLESAEIAGVERFFFSSSACAYNTDLQSTNQDISLKESDAWPAKPERGYGFAKLYMEEMCRYYFEDYGLETRVARYHNVYGPHGTWTGGREKAPAAICRKVIDAKMSGIHDIEIWGDGEQTRSFMYVDDCVEGTMRIMDSDYRWPLNLGSEELVTVNELVTIIEEIAGVKLNRHYNLNAPQGVRGRNSDNSLIREQLNWEPSIPLREGLQETYAWIESEMKR